jgi:ankyrin repeat protein
VTVSDVVVLQTVFSSIVVNHLQQKYGSQSCPVLCLYLNYKEKSSQTCSSLLGSLLKQCLQLQKSSPLPMDLLDWYEEAKATKAGPKEKDIFNALKRAINNYDRLFLVVDALDECDFREMLLAELQGLPADKLSLMITSRPIDGEERAVAVDCNVCKHRDVELYYHCSICNIEICSTCEENDNPCKAQSHTLAEPSGRVEIILKTPPGEIRQYVEYEIGKEIGTYGSQLYDNRRYSSRPDSTRLGRRCGKDPSLQKRIPDVIVERADGRFLFAKLYLDSLKSKQTKRQIQEALESFPDSLEKIYEEALQRIRKQKHREDRVLGMKTLSRVFCARRHLSLAELQHALAVEPGEDDFDQDMDYLMEDILASCAGLITIDAKGVAVRFVHLTLQTYLDSTYEKWIPQAEIEMTQICLSYLLYDVFTEPCDNASFDQRRQNYPFIAYASQEWGTHVRNAGPDPDVEAAALQIVSDPHRVAAYVQAAWFTDNRGSSSWDCRRGIEGLHVCAWLGLSKLIDVLLQKRSDVDAQESTYGQTPLMYACRAGHVETVQKLLTMSASVNIVSGRGRTALLEAVAEGRDEVVELLLDKEELDVNVQNIKKSNQTALMLATDLGYSSIVDMLIEHPHHPNIDINQQNSDGLTALFLASAKNHYYVVESLLRKPGIKVNLQDFISRRAALFVAAERDNCAIVELLLENGADPMLRDAQGGGTALHRAADHNCMSVIKLMIERKIDLSCVDDDRRGLVHSAAANGWPDVIRLLVDNGLSPVARDKHGLTPLHDASRAGKDHVTKTLLSLGADPTITDSYDRTPTKVAWQYGHVKIMNILEGKDESDDDALKSIPAPEHLPGWSMAKLGIKDLVEHAITSRQTRLTEVEPISHDNALHHSVHGNHLDILRMLLESQMISPNDVNRYRRTPLHLAAMGHLELSTEMLKHGAKVNLEDLWGKTPLSIAQTNQHYAIAIALIEADATIDPQKIQVQQLFFAAIQLGSVKSVQALLANGANILDRNPEGLTPRQVAKGANQGEILQLLMTTPSVVYAAHSEPSSKPTEMEELMPVVSPEAEHRFVPFRSRPIVL